MTKKNVLDVVEMKGDAEPSFPTYKITGKSDFIFSLISGIRNAGKSNLMLNILEIEKDVMLSGLNKVYFISPTRDAKIRAFMDKYEDNFEYVEDFTQKGFEDVLTDIKERLDEWKKTRKIGDIYRKYKKNHKGLTDDELIKLEEYLIANNVVIDDLDDEIKHYQAYPPISTIMIDDNLASPMLSQAQSKAGKWFAKYAIKHRHFPYYSNLFIATQHIKSISKILRVNTTMFIMFPFRDTTIYESVFKEIAGMFKNDFNLFVDIMNRIEETPHSFLLVYYDKAKFVRQDLNKEITI